MDAADKRMLEREALRNMIQQWNANRLDLFELSEPNENLEFHGVMRFYFQDSGQKVATKCIRVASDATVSDVIEILIEKFRPDMRMLSLGSYSLWETHGPEDERRLEPHEKPLLVQLNWHADDREGRFLLKCTTGNEGSVTSSNEKGDQNFKRKLSKREKKELKKKEKLSRLKSDANNENRTAEKLYTELPETSFTRSISNPEAVMRRRRQQKLERKLQQFRSKDGGPDTGGTLKIYGSSLCPDVPYKTLLLSVGDTAAGVVREMLDKYGLSRQDPQQYCIVQVDAADNAEYILEDDECPLAIVMTHQHRGSIMFHVRRRPADSQVRRRKKKAGGGGGGSASASRHAAEPMLVEVAPDGTQLENGRRLRINDVVEVGSGNGTALQLYGPSIQPRHCVVAPADGGGYTVTPLHTDAHVYVNGRRAAHSQRLQHGCLLKFGRVSTFRFVDPAQENILNRNLSQSQHFGSGSIYDRSPASPGGDTGAMSPTSMDTTNPNNNDSEYPRTMSPVSGHDTYGYRDSNDTIPPYNNNNTLKLDNESLMMSQHLNESKDLQNFIRDEHTGSVYNDQDQNSIANRTANSQYKDNYETTFDLEGNVETKSICSAKSGGSGHDNRMGSQTTVRPGQEAILPAVLEFPEAGQAQFLAAVISRLDPHAPAFKLAPVYTLYLCARYRASTHYRPELTPTERAHKLTAFLHHVATLIHATVQERCSDSAAQAFWMANASELLHFLKCDRHISSFSTQAQELLPTTVQNAFSNLVTCFQEELSRALSTLSNPAAPDATEATAPTLQALAAAMVLLRRCRVNAALTIQLFSHLFHFINAVCFNKLVTEAGCATARWGAALSARLALLGAWAERQGLELAADCHLARTHQAARLVQGEYRTAEEVRAGLAACFKLNSVQVRALLAPRVPPAVLDAAVAHARALADELYKADGREIRLEESRWLGVGLLIPGDGFSAEVVRGVPPGLAEFVLPLQRGRLCRLAPQPHALGLWTVYMAPRTMPPQPAVHLIHLHKTSNGMGLSIVAAKGAGQSKLGIYIKSVVAGGAAAADGRLAAGDQLLSVDGHSLQGITQEKAAEYLVRTGPTVTLEVAKQGAVLHGLATLLHQPAYNQRQECAEDDRVELECKLRRNSGTFTNTHPALLTPATPRSELVTAGFNRRSCFDRYYHRDESTESSTTEESEDCQPHYHGSIPRLIITLDDENNQLREDLSPDTPGYLPEFQCSDQPRPIPVFAFTCEDFDEQNASDCNEMNVDEPELPPPVPDPPAMYDQSSESGEMISLPPKMKPIDTKLTLDLFNVNRNDNVFYRKRCTSMAECVSACECCRTPQPEPQPIPYIDEPDFEPLIFENEVIRDKVTTPKTRRILPALSLDKGEEVKPETADAVCQTPSSPVDTELKPSPDTLTITNREQDLKLDGAREAKQFNDIHCRLKRALFSMSKSYSSKSEDTEAPSTYTTSESCENPWNNKNIIANIVDTPVDTKAKRVLDSVERKSWKSPDEFRPSFGRVKALAKHFNNINLTYCVKNYKRNCQSSPNLCVRDDKSLKMTEILPSSTSLADLLYESKCSDTSETKTNKMSEDEVKSIIIQLEDWSKYGSRGSEDTLAQGNEFELPNLPSEEQSENNSNGNYIFNEIIDTKPRRITLDSIKIKSNQSSSHSENAKCSKESLTRSGSSENTNSLQVPKVVGMIRRKSSGSHLDVSVSMDSKSRRASYSSVVQSCPQLADPARAGGTGGGARRASERDLPARLAAEAVKPSKSTPALHHVADAPNNTVAGAVPVSVAGWAGKSRSSHNLATQQHDAFYQNLASVHEGHSPNQDRWSSVRSSGMNNRPQSAHFSTSENAPDSPLLIQTNHSTMNLRAAKLAEMSEEVTRRQQQQQMQYQPGAKPPSILPHHHINQTIHQHYPQSPPMHSPMQIQQAHSMPQGIHQSASNIHQSPSMQQGLHQSASSIHQSPSMQQGLNQSQPGMYQAQSMPQGIHQAAMPGMQHGNPVQSPPPNHIYHNQQQQRYEWHPPGPPSPQRAQPPVAPKPHSIRRGDDMDDPPQSPLLTQMMAAATLDDERYTASAVEPRGAQNPWQREEQERRAEQRRAVNRARRDALIAQLVSLGSARSPAQSQQLRALQLERDFQRRANEQEENGGMETGVDDESPPIAMSPPPPAAAGPALAPPKSILKTHPRPELTNGYMPEQNEATDESGSRVAAPPAPPSRGSSFAVMAERTHTMSPAMMADRAHTMSPTAISERAHAMSPAMADRAHTMSPTGLDRNNVMSPATPAAPASEAGDSHQGDWSGRGDKRVSFESESPPAVPPPAPPSQPPPARDPHSFLEEAESMLSPASPDTPPAHAHVHTPGVIGAQEVYKDPRTRRLAALSAAAERARLPEALSFKDKMKMFALEAGDAHTPKDKVKISRAQRDIDAVH